jgi:hypothetical protein
MRWLFGGPFERDARLNHFVQAFVFCASQAKYNENGGQGWIRTSVR